MKVQIDPGFETGVVLNLQAWPFLNVPFLQLVIEKMVPHSDQKFFVR